MSDILLIEGESIMSFLFGGKLFSLLFKWQEKEL
jgi:hypothetical protein